MANWVAAKHKDNISSLEMLISCDYFKVIKKTGNWEIELIPDNNLIEKNNYPDWYGYKKKKVNKDLRIYYLHKNFIKYSYSYLYF